MAASVMEKIRSEADYKEMIALHEVFAVYFFKKECKVSRQVASMLEGLVGEFQRVKVSRVDIEESPEIGEANGVEETPSFIFYKQKVVIDKVTGSGEEFLRKVRSGLEKLTKKVHRITTVSELDLVKALHPRILAYFCGGWVEDQSFESQLEEIAAQTENVKLIKIDVNESEFLAKEFCVPVVPCVGILDGFKNHILLPPLTPDRIQASIDFLCRNIPPSKKSPKSGRGKPNISTVLEARVE